MNDSEIGLLVLLELVYGILSALFGSLLFDKYWGYRETLAKNQHALELKKLEMELKKIEIYSERAR